MTRINTNVSSLTAQKSLARTNVSLQEALTRLSTGLRINTGKDDPAGLIASEMLRSDIISGQRAITNSERANQMIATADGALAQVSALLNDIRGLITEAANTGALSAEQIAANQAQVDSSLEALNRIAQTTTFQGRRLLDGSLNFISTAQAVATIEDIEIDQANLGATGQIGVNVAIATAATQATIESASGDANAVTQLKFSSRVRLDMTIQEIDLIARTVGPQYEDVTVNFINDKLDASAEAGYDQDSKVITVHYEAGATDLVTLETALNTLTDFVAIREAGADADLMTLAVTSPTQMASPTLNFTAETAGSAYNGVAVSVVSSDLGVADTPYQATYNAVSKRLVVTVNSNAAGDRLLSDVATDLDAALDGYFDVATTDVTEIRANLAGAPETSAVGNSEISGYLRSGFSAGTRATATLSFAPGATAVLVTDHASASTSIDIKSTSLTAGDGVEISFLDDAAIGAGEEYAVYDSGAGTLVVHYDDTNSTVDQVVAAINALDDWAAAIEATEAAAGEGASKMNSATLQPQVTTDTDTLEIAALNPGADYNQLEILLETVDSLGDPRASYNSTTNQLTIQIDATGSEDLADIKDAVDLLSGFSAAAHQRGVTDGRIYGAQVDATATANTSATGGNTLLDDLVIEIGGTDGSEAFNFQTGASVNSVMAAINLISDATGVAATQSAGLLTLTSVRYGSNGLVYTDVINEGTVGAFEDSASARRANGTDIDATVNGIAATGDGNELSINTATLDLALTVTAGSSTDFEFEITGGGAMFQLGPDVVSNQQARLGIQSVNAARLRGVSGRLYQVGSGQSAALATDPTTAAAIVDEVIIKVTELRGRLGAFQKTTVESNVRALQETLENLTAAESSIRDADFAVETAALTRAQILVQSGMSVLSIANSNPQNVLALLR